MVEGILKSYHELFRIELGKFKDRITILILFINKTNVKGLKQRLYRIGVRDKKAIDDVFDLLTFGGASRKATFRRAFTVSSSSLCGMKRTETSSSYRPS